MLSSYGEARILHTSRHIGRVRLKSITALPALGPRLSFRFGFQLHEQGARPSGAEALRDYRLTDLTGDVRLKENGPYVASLEWSGTRGHVRSTDYGDESDIQLTCDLDWQRLEALERHRSGKQLELWVALWPRLERDGSLLEASIDPFRAQVPAADWIPVLQQTRGDRIEVLEVPIPGPIAEKFQACIDELAEARRLVEFGEYAMPSYAVEKPPKCWPS